MNEEKELAITISFSVDTFGKVMEATHAMYPEIAKQIATEMKEHILEKNPELAHEFDKTDTSNSD